MREKEEWVEFHVRVKKATDLALLCHVSGFDDDVWFPRSQIDVDNSEVSEDGDVGALFVTEWIATQKNLV